MTVEKTFRFDAGHRALGFADCKEASLHGHTWTLRLVIETDAALDGYKTIFDTNELALVVKPLIDDLDHSFILWREDPICAGLERLCREAGIDGWLRIVDFNPTLEGLCEHLFHTVRERLPLRGARLARAELDATATLRATYHHP